MIDFGISQSASATSRADAHSEAVHVSLPGTVVISFGDTRNDC